MTTSNEHNNAPAVPQGLERYEPTVMVEESRGRLTATCAVMKPKEDGRWVRLRDLTATPASAPAQYKDSTPQLSVGESSFESWFESYNPANKGDKQRARDAYAAGMGDPLVTAKPAQEVGLTDEEITQVCSGIYLSDHPQGSASYDVALARAIIAAHEAKQATAPAPAPAQEIDKSVADAEIKSMYVESQGSDKGWLGIEGSYFIGGVVAARKQKAAPAPAQDEPLGHFRVEPFGWTDCAKDDEGAIALYERPQEVGLTEEEIEAIAKKHMSTVGDHWCNEEAIREIHAEDFARAIIAALRAKGGKHV